MVSICSPTLEAFRTLLNPTPTLFHPSPLLIILKALLNHTHFCSAQFLLYSPPLIYTQPYLFLLTHIKTCTNFSPNQPHSALHRLIPLHFPYVSPASLLSQVLIYPTFTYTSLNTPNPLPNHTHSLTTPTGVLVAPWWRC